MDTLLDLLKTKTIKQVTVAEICRRVSINRSTFYEHFLDVYDVLEQIADTVAKEAVCVAPKKMPTEESFILLCNHIKEHKDFYALYFKQGLPSSIQSKFFLSSPPPHPYKTTDARSIANDVYFEYYCTFFRAGVDAMIQKWLDRECRETPEELFAILQNSFDAPEGL